MNISWMLGKQVDICEFQVSQEYTEDLSQKRKTKPKFKKIVKQVMICHQMAMTVLIKFYQANSKKLKLTEILTLM